MSNRRMILCGVVLALSLSGTTGCAPETQATIEAGKTATPATLWTCGMHPQVVQDRPGTCPICNMTLVPLQTAPHEGHNAPEEHNGPEGRDQTTAAPAMPAATPVRTVKYWWDPMMSPPYISDRPGKSPMGMDLVPVYADEGGAGTVTIDPAMVQNMGLRTAAVVVGALRTTVRAAGVLAEAQPNQHDVNLRVSGWIERLYANVEGMHLTAGAPLFDLYSPELQLAIEEFIVARRARDDARHGATGNAIATGAVYAAAERKLRLLGLAETQVADFARLDRAPATVRFTSPMSGHLIEKPVVQGSAVKAGDRVLRIVDHSLLWVDAQVYAPQLPYLQLGERATATVAGVPGRTFAGEIVFIHPHVDTATRTTMTRFVIRNPALDLRPGMYATVEIAHELEPRALLVPRAAVIDTGLQQVAFVALGEGRFAPRRLTVGPAGEDGVVQVLAGLAPGDQVVTSGQFLLDAESRFREAIRKFLSARDTVPAAGAAAAGENHDRQAH
ncbi:efflux RND transporter periplasmic adaptor subunit [Candidatus Binatia bacterium]|nr:efflux RND transporter periplasmic adaptor subunit [Candidatus Binatia bacterium]